MTKAITAEWLREQRACEAQLEIFQRVFPNGSDLTEADLDKAITAGLDRLWSLLRLADGALRREFLVFTLRQRHPNIVALFERAGFKEHAAAIAGIDWADLTRAQEILNAAWAAARDAARAAAWAAAWDAARAAARAAAWAAAWDAAWDAARAAAWDAARAAAWAAARDAAWDAAYREQCLWLIERLTERPQREKSGHSEEEE
jgi:hypothetical protein